MELYQEVIEDFLTTVPLYVILYFCFGWIFNLVDNHFKEKKRIFAEIHRLRERLEEQNLEILQQRILINHHGVVFSNDSDFILTPLGEDALIFEEDDFHPISLDEPKNWEKNGF